MLQRLHDSQATPLWARFRGGGIGQFPRGETFYPRAVSTPAGFHIRTLRSCSFHLSRKRVYFRWDTTETSRDQADLPLILFLLPNMAVHFNDIFKTQHRNMLEQERKPIEDHASQHKIQHMQIKWSESTNDNPPQTGAPPGTSTAGQLEPHSQQQPITVSSRSTLSPSEQTKHCRRFHDSFLPEKTYNYAHQHKQTQVNRLLRTKQEHSENNSSNNSGIEKTTIIEEMIAYCFT